MAKPAAKSSQKRSLAQPQDGANELEIFCQPCDRFDKRLPVVGYCVECEEYLCKTCYKTHTRPKPVHHHHLLDSKHMPLPKTCSRKTCNITTSCPQHMDELIGFYCHDHNALICSICVTDVHTSCHVHYIPDISEQIIDSSEFNKTINDLNKISDKCFRITKELEQRIDKSSTQLTDITEEIENLRKMFNERFDELKQKISKSATSIQNHSNGLLKTTKTECDDIIKSLQETGHSLKDINTCEKSDQLFAEIKIAQQLILDNVKKVLNISVAKDVDEYSFELDQTLKTLVKNKKPLGNLIGKKQMKQAMTAMNMSKPKFINVRTQSDEKDCNVSGIVVTPEDQLFVADHNNKAVKMIAIESGAIMQVGLESEPWDITSVDSDTLAVTLPFSETIQFVSFTSNSFTLENKLKVGGMCFGISHHQGKLVVAYPIESKLLIMDLTGTVLEEVTKDFNGDDIFSHPEYVFTNSQSIYVSDRDKGTVIWLNWQGEVIGSNCSIQFPRGLAAFDDASFLVNDNNRNCIVQIHRDCRESKIVLNDIFKPHALGWCPRTSTLCVSRANPFKEEGDSHIVMYKMMQDSETKSDIILSNI